MGCRRTSFSRVRNGKTVDMKCIERKAIPFLRVPGSDRLAKWFAYLPPGLVLAIARLMARPRRICAYPGWHCGIDYYGLDLGPRFRTAIWKYCNERNMESPVKMRFSKGLHVYSYVGNDISQCLFVGGSYEPNEFSFLDHTLNQGMAFIDIGANEGLYALFAAAKVGKKGSVLALEPSRREYARLMDNLRLNNLKNVKPLRLAASDFNGIARLNVAGYMHEGHNTLGELSREVEFSHSEEIEVKRIDDVIAEEGIAKVDVVKIDVEGAEKSIIAGMEKTIENDRPILLVEIFDNALRGQGSSAEELIRILVSKGYYLYIFSAYDGQPIPLQNMPSESENVLALPDDWMKHHGRH